MRMKRRIRTDVCLILCGILVWFLADARQLRLEAAKALTLCAGTVIPALFPFMVVTGLLVRLGFGQWLAPDMAGLMASLFRLPGCAGSALLLGLVGGYPIGARTAAELYASGDLTRAEALLANYSDHNAEWNFLRGAVCYRRGWMDEALRYYQTACQMDPGNAEYRRALDFMEHAGETAYHPEGRPFGTDMCTANPCLTLCCAYTLCNGGGYFFCC